MHMYMWCAYILYASVPQKVWSAREGVGLPKADPVEYWWAMRDNEKSNDGQVSRGE